MDMDKLCEIITTRPDLRDIPLSHIFNVAFAVLEEIDKGDCYYDTEENRCLSNTTLIQQDEE